MHAYQKCSDVTAIAHGVNLICDYSPIHYANTSDFHTTNKKQVMKKYRIGKTSFPYSTLFSRSLNPDILGLSRALLFDTKNPLIAT